MAQRSMSRDLWALAGQRNDGWAPGGFSAGAAIPQPTIQPRPQPVQTAFRPAQPATPPKPIQPSIRPSVQALVPDHEGTEEGTRSMQGPVATEGGCAVEHTDAPSPYAEGHPLSGLTLDALSARQGMILSEVLGPPVSRRRRRF